MMNANSRFGTLSYTLCIQSCIHICRSVREQQTNLVLKISVVCIEVLPSLKLNIALTSSPRERGILAMFIFGVCV